MRNRTVLWIGALIVAQLVAGSVVMARETIHELSIEDALAVPKIKARLLDVPIYFGDQPHPPIAKNLGEYSTNKKTNAFNKSDLEARQWVFLSAILQLQERARMEGGNAVINIKSNYEHRLTSSETKFTCGAGKIVAGVALRGQVVKLEESTSPEMLKTLSEAAEKGE